MKPGTKVLFTGTIGGEIGRDGKGRIIHTKEGLKSNIELTFESNTADEATCSYKLNGKTHKIVLPLGSLIEK